MTMSVAEEERCKELLVKLKDAIDKRGIMLDKLGKVMDEMVSSLATSTPLLVSAAADSTPISTATNKVFAVANAAPSADAALTDQARNRCSRSGPDTNARDKSVAALIGLTTGTSMVIPVPVEHSTDSSSKLLSTSELDKRMTTRCLMSCSNDNTASQTSAFMPDAASGPPSTAALLDIAITSPEPTVATLLVRDGTSVLTSTPSGAAVHSIDLGDKHIPKLPCYQLGARKLFDEMPIRSTMGLWPPPMKWDERQLWPPPLGSATILQFFIVLARFKMMRTKLAEVELNVVESFMQKWLGATIHVVSRGSYSVWRSLVIEKDMQWLVVKKARCILWLFDLIVELVGRVGGSNLVNSFIENDLQRRCYINFIRRVNDKRGSEGLEETKKAFNFMLNYVGHDVASGPVWMEYIAFLKSMPVVTPQEESHRMTTVWKVYQKAILVPTSHVEQLWKDCDNFENFVSRTLAKGLLSEYQSKYSSAKAVYIERRKYIDNIDWNMLAIPPTGSYKGEKQCMTWKRLLAFKKGNPQRIDATTANRHVTFTYEQCLMYLYHHPDVWYDYAMWHAKNDSTDSTIKIFQHALKVLPDSEVLTYAFAELEESRGAIQPAKIIYESLVAENESMTSLAYIQFIRFLRRTEGIEAAHKYFLDAQKLPSCTYDVYVAYATMAFCLDKDAKVAQSVFEAGLKLFMHEPGYILEYADFLRQGVWLTSASSIWTPGRFYLTVLDNCLYASINAEPPQLYYQKGVDATDAMVQSKVNIFSGEVKNCTTYNSFLQAQFMSLEGDGHLRLYGWDGISWKPLADVLNGYPDDCAYHMVCGDCVQDRLSMGVLQVPWEPGGADFFRKAFHTTAWGQAESQGGENVMNRLVSWAVGLTVQWADLLGEYKSNEHQQNEDHRRKNSWLSIFFLLPICYTSKLQLLPQFSSL